MPKKPPVRRRGRAHQPRGSTQVAMPKKPRGLRYKQPNLVGKHVFRVREIHVRDHLVPLLRKNRLGAAKLDLILRGLALNPQHTGKRSTPGLVLNRFATKTCTTSCVGLTGSAATRPATPTPTIQTWPG